MTADIVIVGGGPTGLMLACELRLAGADPVVLERLPEISEIPKGNGLVGQIVPMLDYRGLLERFSAGVTFAYRRRGGPRLRRPGERHHRPQRGSARSGRRAAHPARRLRHLGVVTSRACSNACSSR